MSQYCHVCDTDVVVESGTQGTVCTQCGEVLEESRFDNSAQFGASGGSHYLVGQTARGSGANLTRGLFGSTSSNSRDETINKARHRLEALVSEMRLSSLLVDHALSTYRIALQYGLTKGKKANHIAAACLYIACRAKATPHMLLDFSVVLKTDVFVLGHCFMKLRERLNLPIPIAEPFFYIRRFCSQLEFGDKYIDVVNTTNKLVSAMKRDWMQTGRRPAGLCAAAILIAARLHGFRRTQDEVVRVARICGATLSRRLREFEQTPTASMTPDEFHEQAEALELFQMNAADLPQCAPPAFQRAEKERLIKAEFEAMIKKKNGNETPIQEQEQTVHSSELTATSESEASANLSDQHISISQLVEELQEKTQAKDFQLLEDEFNTSKKQEKTLDTSSASIDQSILSDQATQSYTSSNYVQEDNEETSTIQPTQSEDQTQQPSTGAADQSTLDVENQDMTEDAQVYGDYDENGNYIEYSSVDEAFAQAEEPEQPEQTDEYENHVFDDVDDNEIDTYIVIDETEVEMRTRIWDDLYLDFLKQQEEKKKEKERLRLQKIELMGERRSKKRKRIEEEQQAPARSAAEAAATALRAKMSRRYLEEHIGLNVNSLFEQENSQPDALDSIFDQPLSKRGRSY